jgi:PAS domain S-box-containing protein
MLDAEGKVTTWNLGAERIKGYQAAEIVGQHFSRFYPPEDVAAGKPEAELKVAAGAGRFAGEGWRVRKDGTRFWASIVVNAVRDEKNQLVGFAKITHDLTERRQAEEQRARLLQEQRAREVAEAEKERSRFLSEASAVLASSLDYEATLQKLADIVVPQYADWCSVEILEGDKIQQVAVAHIDPAKVKLAQELQRRWPTGPNGTIGTANIVRTDKSALYPDIPDELLVQTTRDAEHLRIARELHLRSELVVPLIARGKTLGALTLVWAESDRRYSRDDVPLMEELGLRAGIAVDNARLYRETQESVRLRDEFLSIASHELKTPLTSLQLQVSSIQRSVKQGRPEQVTLKKLVSKVDSIDGQVERLNKLINDLLDVSRATTGRLQLHLEDVDLAEVVGEVTTRFKDDLAAAQCALSLNLERGIVGHWDRLRIDQIVANFIANAMKYGTGKSIEITTIARDVGAVITVRDYGIGIATKDHARIFERFGRAVPTERYGGFGLGLWIVRIFVEAMGGKVKVESEPGTGSTFIVELPLVGKATEVAIA